MSHNFFLFFFFFCPQLILHFSSIFSKFLHFSIFSLFFSTFAETFLRSEKNLRSAPGKTGSADTDPAPRRNNRKNSAKSLPSTLRGADTRAFQHEKAHVFQAAEHGFSLYFYRFGVCLSADGGQCRQMVKNAARPGKKKKNARVLKPDAPKTGNFFPKRRTRPTFPGPRHLFRTAAAAGLPTLPAFRRPLRSTEDGLPEPLPRPPLVSHIPLYPTRLCPFASHAPSPPPSIPLSASGIFPHVHTRDERVAAWQDAS